MTSAEHDLHVRGKQLVSELNPFPLFSDFSTGHAHCALGLANGRSPGYPYFFLGNNLEEIWLFCNCRVQASALKSDGLTFRLSTTEQARNPTAPD